MRASPGEGWERGRRSADGLAYWKKRLWLFLCGWFQFDCWLLCYQQGCGITRHSDTITGMRHWRFNIVYQDCKEGGDLICESAMINWRRLKVFRSDLPHEVTEVLQGERRVFSLGLAL